MRVVGAVDRVVAVRGAGIDGTQRLDVPHIATVTEIYESLELSVDQRRRGTATRHTVDRTPIGGRSRGRTLANAGPIVDE